MSGNEAALFLSYVKKTELVYLLCMYFIIKYSWIAHQLCTGTSLGRYHN